MVLGGPPKSKRAASNGKDRPYGVTHPHPGARGVWRADLSEEAWSCNALRKISAPASRSWPTEAGITCEGCGSAQLRCGEEARRTHDHGLTVYLWCPNDVHPRGAYQYFTIPPGEVIGT